MPRGQIGSGVDTQTGRHEMRADSPLSEQPWTRDEQKSGGNYAKAE